ncbi:hypothetical protein RM844_18360 [Streptomyces sp. DSM 44915]|uniref:Transcription factor zinc-finger domain-containing protein n=1 Tax=Streptomyces chisholmiae TaxID=3075540 RepID=A0ABU2JU12_9ACTN|nr:hypothetical protein [Streptomyces sp. DSM 44915]MDT0268251.1 hypothetical protein [Streptomyces sp. DSM 44915]
MSDSSCCPCCWQEWPRAYRFRSDGVGFLLCVECESVWWPGDDLGTVDVRSLGDFVAARLGVVGSPWGERGWADVIEPVPDS